MSVTYNGLTFELLGHASVQIETPDETIVYVDPWNKVLAGEPADGDIVLVTHDDHDHYDPVGIAAVSTPDTTIVVFAGVDTLPLDHDVRSIGVDESLTVDDVTVQTVPAYNLPDGEHVRESGEPFHVEGDGVGYLIQVDEMTVFVPGDTDLLPAHDAITADVLIPPIGGTYTMDRIDAAALAETVDAKLVIPIHYDTFEAIETDVDAFISDLQAQGRQVEIP